MNHSIDDIGRIGVSCGLACLDTTPLVHSHIHALGGSGGGKGTKVAATLIATAVATLTATPIATHIAPPIATLKSLSDAEIEVLVDSSTDVRSPIGSSTTSRRCARGSRWAPTWTRPSTTRARRC